MAAPRPLAEPVTRATLPSRRKLCRIEVINANDIVPHMQMATMQCLTVFQALSYGGNPAMFSI